MKSSPIIAALIGAAIPVAANAVCSAGNCEGVGEQVARSVLLSPSGDIWLKAPADKAALNCKLFLGDGMVLRQDHPLFKESYALILTALATKKPWMVRILEGSPICEIDYVMMYAK